MIAYVESSAVLAWLLAEPTAELVTTRLNSAADILSSDLTLVECDRAFHRAAAAGNLSEIEAGAGRAALADAAAHWTLLSVAAEVVDRARRPFPTEPLRAIDAIHISSALSARSVHPGIVLLSLDRRVRANGAALGFVLEPSDDELAGIRSADDV